MAITLEKVSKIDGQKLTGLDIQKIDNNATIIQDTINALPTSSGSTITTSTINGNIKINGVDSVVYTHPSGTNPHGTTKSDVGLGNVTNESKTTMFTNPTFIGSVNEGYGTTASGLYSHSGGWNTQAINQCSHAEGYNTLAGFEQFVMGQYNTLEMDYSSYIASANAFIIGNGTSSSALGNAFKVTFDGKTYADGAYASTGADYAEYFEWLDSNKDNEDRVGFFVTLDGDKIRKANSTDDYILGIVSATPSVVGDNYESWQDKYVIDEFGRVQYEDVLVPAKYETIDNKEVLISEEHTDTIPKYNPNWDSSKEYISRENRPEWSPIGIMGKLLVRDDGTCIINGYCKSNNEGIATVCDKTFDIKYRVMKRISDNIIQVLVK